MKRRARFSVPGRERGRGSRGMNAKGGKATRREGRQNERITRAAQAPFCKHGRPSCNGYVGARGRWEDNITIPDIEQRFSTYRDRDRDLRRHQELLLCGERDRGFLTSFFHHRPLDFSQSSLTDLTWTVLHLVYRRRDVLAR